MSTICWLLTLLAILPVMYAISYKSEESLNDILPVTTGGVLIILYILAFLRGMILIVPIVTGLFIFCILKGKSDISGHLKGIRDFYLNPQAVVIIISLILAAVLTSDHIALWWDDLNYWATDAKALYYLNGFPGKYGNVSPEFGDYTPGIQIIKWIFMKLKSDYDEGLAFSGYYVMGMIFLLPLLKPVKQRNFFVQTVAMFTILLIPGVCNKVWSEGTCADVIMGIVFGALLVAIIDIDGHRQWFYYARISVYSAVLVLCKSTGFEWAIYAFVYFIICYFLYSKSNTSGKNAELKVKAIGLTTILPVCTLASWWGFCLINRRIAKLTSSGVNAITHNGYDIKSYFGEKFENFIKGFAFYPIHTDNTFLLDISSLGILIIFLVTILVLYRLAIISAKERRALIIYTLITAILTYGIILLGHITIFAVETQYDTPEVMAISLSRYASPFTIGMLMLLLYIIISRTDKYLLWLSCMMFILLTTNYKAYVETVYSYKENITAEREARAQVVDEAGNKYLGRISGNKELWGKRVLYLRDNDSIHWIKDTYISFYASPVPTVYDGFDAETYNSEDVKNIILKNHAEYLYVDEQAEDATKIFEQFFESGEFKYATIYYIFHNGNKIELRELGE